MPLQSFTYRVAAHPLCAVTPAWQAPSPALSQWDSKGSKTLRGVEGQSPFRHLPPSVNGIRKGRRPFAGWRGRAPPVT